jgi:hypothetical protein
MDETPGNHSREPREVIGALADLFDSVSPERPIEAEEELLEAGRDPAAIAMAMRRVADDKLGFPTGTRARRAARDASGTREHEGRAHRSRPRWRALALLAAGFVGGILASTWLADRPDVWRPWPLPSMRSSARDGLRLPAEPGSNASFPHPSAPQGPAAVLPSGASRPVKSAPALAEHDAKETQPVRAASSPAEDTLRPLPSPAEGSLGVIAELNAKTWQLAVGRMPPELLRHYRDGEWWHTIHQLSPEVHLQDPTLLEAGEANRGRFSIGEHAVIMDVAEGKQAETIYGPPFPVIDASDPQAGQQIVWN